MPVCKQCTRSRPIEEDEIKVDKQRGLILKHFKPCPGTKKFNAENEGKECGSTEYFTGPKDDSKARTIAGKKGIEEEELAKFSVTQNPGVEPHEIVSMFDDAFAWVETIEDEATREAERDKLKNHLETYKAGQSGEALDEALNEAEVTEDVEPEQE